MPLLCDPTLSLIVGRDVDATGVEAGGGGVGNALGTGGRTRGAGLVTTGGWALSAASKVLLMMVHSVNW